MVEFGKASAHTSGPCPTGIVLAGGGALGAYEVGVLEALVTGRWRHGLGPPVDPEIYSGTSVGAYNAAFIVSRRLVQSSVEAIQDLRRTWLERIAAIPGKQVNGIYFLRGTLPPNQGNPRALLMRCSSLVEKMLSDSRRLARAWARQLLSRSPSPHTWAEDFDEVFNLGAWISTSPFARLIQETIDPQRLLGARACSLSIVTTQWDLGESAVFCNHPHPKAEDVIYAFRHIPLSTANMAEAIRASTAIPGLFPAPRIGPSFFVDGGVLMNTPLLPALQAGARTVHVVTVQPKPTQLPVGQTPTTLGTLGRLWSYLPSAAVNSDLELLQVLGKLRELALELATHSARHPPSHLSADKIRRLDRFTKLFGKPIPLTVHRHVPSLPVGAATKLLNFRQQHLQRLLGLGFRDAVQHDCRVNGCIV